jgi:hypothetical protein
VKMEPLLCSIRQGEAVLNLEVSPGSHLIFPQKLSNDLTQFFVESCFGVLETALLAAASTSNKTSLIPCINRTTLTLSEV